MTVRLQEPLHFSSSLSRAVTLGDTRIIKRTVSLFTAVQCYERDEFLPTAKFSVVPRLSQLPSSSFQAKDLHTRKSRNEQ
jgi:hypothetical protein